MYKTLHQAEGFMHFVIRGPIKVRLKEKVSDVTYPQLIVRFS